MVSRSVILLNGAISLYSFILTTLYWDGISGAATSPRWSFLAVATSLFLLFLHKKETKFTILHLTGLLFVIWCFVSLFWSFNRYDTIDALLKLLILTQVFILGSKLETLKYVFIGLAFGLFVSLFVSFDAGLFVNKDVLAETSLFILVGLLVYELWWLTALIIPLFVTNYTVRGPFFIIGVLIGIWFWNKNKLVTLFILLLFALGCFYIYHFDVRIISVTQRLEIWINSLRGFSFIGHGYGTFHNTYPIYSDGDLVRPRFAHNEFLQILFENGIIGLILTIWFCINTIHEKEKYIVLAWLLSACLYYSFNIPVSAFIFCITAGYISRNRSSVFNKNSIGRILVC